MKTRTVVIGAIFMLASIFSVFSSDGNVGLPFVAINAVGIVSMLASEAIGRKKTVASEERV